MPKVLLTGGTGLIGKQLQKTLKKQAIEVVVLSRTPSAKNEFLWNINEKYIAEDAFANVTHIIHLAGAGIADKRWTSKRKKELLDSRVASTALLLEKVQELNLPIQKFIAASGIGFYGAVNSSKIYTEEDTPHNDFIASICVAWEKEVKQFEKYNIPTTIFRTSVVLAKNGGALQKMNTPLFLAILGNGKQSLPWIHIEDLCNMYTLAVTNKNFNGVFNAVAPETQTNYSFTKALASATNKFLLPITIPASVLKIILGELALMLLKGSAISSNKIQQYYSFKYKNLKEALTAIY